MLSAKKLNGSAADIVNYYKEKDGYYFNGLSEKEGATFWYGKGVEKLGLKGEVREKDLHHMLNGELPNGDILGRYQKGERQHRPGYDLTFSAPKSLSVFLGLSEAKDTKEIEKALDKSLRFVLDKIEEDYARARKTENKKTFFTETKNLAYACIHHRASRALDPQKHTHVLVMNATKCSDEKWRALATDFNYGKLNTENNGFFERILLDERHLGMLYRSKLAFELKKQGYEIEITNANHCFFEIKNVPKELIDAFSKRRKEIKSYLTDKNIALSDTRSASIAALATRKAKKEISQEKLFEIWSQECHLLGLSSNPKDWGKRAGIQAQQEGKAQRAKEIQRVEEIRKGEGPQKAQEQSSIFLASPQKEIVSSDYRGNHIRNAEEALNIAIQTLSEREAVFSEERLINKTLSFLIQSSVIDPIEVITAIDQAHQKGILFPAKLGKHVEVYRDEKNNRWIKLKYENKKRAWTTSEAMKIEKETIHMMKEGQDDIIPLLEPSKLNDFFSGRRCDEIMDGLTLTKGQRDAIRSILTTKDQITGIQGYPGVGKTTAMKIVHFLTQEQSYSLKQNHRLIGLAPSARAARRLENESGISSQTISAYLTEAEKLHSLSSSSTSFSSSLSFSHSSSQKEIQEKIDKLSERIKEKIGDQNVTLLVDEASMASTSQIHSLFQLAKKHKLKIVLSGDLNQIGSIEWGRVFWQLQEHGMSTVEMRDIVRQKEGSDLKEAILSTLGGNFENAIQKLKRTIYEIPNKDDRLWALVEAFLSLPQDKRGQNEIGVLTRKEREEVSFLLRDRLKAEESLQKKDYLIPILESINLTQAEKCLAGSYIRKETKQIKESEQTKHTVRTILEEGGREKGVKFENEKNGKSENNRIDEGAVIFFPSFFS
jgi:conjugative relaxase-like TrwC/TraI family protein